MSDYTKKFVQAKQVQLGDFMTDDMIKSVERITKNNPEHDWAGVIAREVMEPNMTEINRKLGQENDARFLAYAVLYALRNSSSG